MQDDTARSQKTNIFSPTPLSHSQTGGWARAEAVAAWAVISLSDHDGHQYHGHKA